MDNGSVGFASSYLLLELQVGIFYENFVSQYIHYTLSIYSQFTSISCREIDALHKYAWEWHECRTLVNLIIGFDFNSIHINDEYSSLHSFILVEWRWCCRRTQYTHSKITEYLAKCFMV